MQPRTVSRDSRPLRVVDPVAARLLVDRGQVRYLAPFLGRAVSASQAAAELDVPLHVVLRRVSAFRRAGLVEVADVRPRAGRAMSLYRSAAEEFFVPIDLVSVDLFMVSERFWHDAFTVSLTDVLLQQVRRLPDGGVRVHRTEEGSVLIEAAAEPGVTWRGAPDVAIAFEWSALSLSDRDADDLRHALLAVHREFAGRQAPQGGRFVVGTCLSPLSERRETRGL
ncbi:MAG: hypothetical protein ACFCVG_09045 [Kineosporiaceae bacterium]